MSQEKKQKTKNSAETENVEDVTSAGTETNVDEEALDNLLDEIDGVLEENAEEFVASYVQKGGQ